MSTRMLVAAAVAASCLGLSAADASSEPKPPKPARRLVLQIHEVKCLDETGGRWREKIGGDEVTLSGLTIDAAGRAVRQQTFRIGKFEKDRSVKRYSPAHSFATFDLRQGPDFPRQYQTMLVLAERDEGGGLVDYVNAIVEGINTGSKPATSDKGGVAHSLLTDPPLSMDAVAAKAVKLAVAKVGQWAKDDIFRPRATKVSMTTAQYRFAKGAVTSRPDTASFKGYGGLYRIVYSWRLVD
jgi:hypothetical protein